MDIKTILAMPCESEDVRLNMILSNRIDYGHQDGGMVSVKQFPELIADLLTWADTRAVATPAPSGERSE